MPRGRQGFLGHVAGDVDPPEAVEVPVELPERESGHIAILRNMARHLLHGEPLIAPGVQGRKTVEMINAMILSGRTGKPVDVPVDRAAYDAFLAGLAGDVQLWQEAGRA